MLNRISISFSVFFFVFLSGIHYANTMTPPSSLVIEPSRVEIGLTYGGKKISINGKIPSDQECLVKITGGDQALHLKEKGKVWGFLWMNVKDISYEDVPILYFIRSSKALDTLSSAGTRQRLLIGYDALKTKIAPDRHSDENQLFGEMIKLKEQEGLFSIKENSVQRTPAGHGMDKIAADIDFPPKAAVGEYSVELLSFKNGESSVIGTGAIKLERSQSVRLLSSMALNNGLLYGCIAVFIALVSGLLTGIIFGMGGKGH